MKQLTLALALLIAWPAFSQRSKNKTEEIQPVVISEGITYSLPRTGIRIIVNATRTVFIPGPYAQYADQMLGIKDVKMQPQTYWEIEKVSFGSFTEPDPENYYKTNPQNIPLVQLTPAGCLAGYNGNDSPVNSEPLAANSFPSGNTGLQTDFLNLISTPGFSGDTPVDQRALKAADLIIKARSARYDIAAGLLDEFHPDGKAYKESLEELCKIEKDNLELFTGKMTSGKNTFFFDFMPPSKTVKGEVVFRFDEKLGFLPKNDFSGKPVMIDVEKDESLPVKTESNNQAAQAANTKTGIFYRQPGMANIRLIKELSVIATTRMTIAQFGFVYPVPAELLNGNYSVEFHCETGAIKSVSKK